MNEERWYNSWVGIGLFWFLLMSGCGVQTYLENKNVGDYDKHTIEILKQVVKDKESIKN